MKKYIGLVLLLCLAYSFSIAQTSQLTAACTRFDEFNTEVRDCKLKKAEAKLKFQQLITEIRAASSFIKDDVAWVFPIQGYTYRAAGGINGDGYSDKGYSYFDGNKHAAHPAHDLFVNDRNQDGIDDKTHKPINILAVSGGVVIACCNEWDTTSNLRGGRYIWLYHPQQNIITYYAHNRELFVKVGDVVKKGEKIAEMGRTGYNAYKKRSPTHVHFSAYHLVNNLPVAYNTYPDLVKTSKK